MEQQEQKNNESQAGRVEPLVSPQFDAIKIAVRLFGEFDGLTHSEAVSILIVLQRLVNQNAKLDLSENVLAKIRDEELSSRITNYGL